MHLKEPPLISVAMRFGFGNEIGTSAGWRLFDGLFQDYFQYAERGRLSPPLFNLAATSQLQNVASESG